MTYTELKNLIDAYINRNGVQAITGQVLNGVLNQMVDQLGRGFQDMGVALPTDNPGTPDGPEAWFATDAGIYTNFGGLTVQPGEFAILYYQAGAWYKKVIYNGFNGATATVDNETGTPSVDLDYQDNTLSFDFHNIKGEPGIPAGFGPVTASVDANVGIPSVTVDSSGPDTAKEFNFSFKNLKGEQGVAGGFGTVSASVNNQVGTPEVIVTSWGPNREKSINFDFKNLKGERGETGIPAGFGSITASVDGNVGTPSVTVSKEGPDTAKNFSFKFHNLKGETGTPGITSVVPYVEDGTGNPSCIASISGQQLNLYFSGLKGEQGNTGVSADYPIAIVNNRYEGGVDKAWSAEQGKLLSEDILFSEYVPMTPISVTPNTRVNTNGTIEGGHSTVSIYQYSVNGGEDYAFSVSMGRRWDLYVVFWYDEDDNFISRENYKGSLTQAVNYTNQPITAPANATTVRVNVQTSMSAYHSFSSEVARNVRDLYDMSVMKTDVVDRLDSTIVTAPLSSNQGRVLKEYIDTFKGDVDEAFMQVDVQIIPTSSVTPNGFYDTDGSFVSRTSWEVWNYDAMDGVDYMFSGKYNASYNVNFISYWDEEDALIAFEPYRGSLSQDVTYTDQRITIPEGTKTIKLNVLKVNSGYFALKTYEYEGYYNVRELGEEVGDLSERVDAIEEQLNNATEGEFIQKVIGKNLINPDDVLNGWTWSSEDGYHARTSGIMSNKMLLSPGTYTIQGVKAYSVATARICWFNDRDQFVRADRIDLDGDNVGTYQVKCSADWWYVRYARLVLQHNTTRPFNPNAAQFEMSSVATEFEPCRVMIAPNPAFGRTPKYIFLSGASIAMTGNGWFENACDRLGYISRNVSVSGESIVDAANKLWHGSLFSPNEFEKTDVFVLSHVHNYNVASTTSTGVLQDKVADYESRCYDSSGNYLEGVTPDPTDNTEFLIPPTGWTTTERYSAAFDYVFKKYAAMCLACKDDPSSRWYGTKSGKPFNVIICSYWHDARVMYNTAAQVLAARHGALYCDFAGQVGFSYHQTDPTDPSSIRQSALYCNNSAYGGGNDTTTETIDGVTYTGMGWHPTRDPNSYLTKKLGKILSEQIAVATTDD